MAKAAPELDPEAPPLRPYGEVVPFERAFALPAVIELARRLVPERVIPVFVFGLAIVLVAALFDMRAALPLPIGIDRQIAGTAVGLWARRALGFHLGVVLAVWVQAVALSTFASWARGHDVEPWEAVGDLQLAIHALAYGMAMSLLELLILGPWVAFVLWRVSSGDAVFAVLGPAVGLVLRAVVIGALQPGLWALSIDRLPVIYALLQSLGAAVRHPAAILTLIGAFWAAMALGCGVFIAPAFLVLGASHAGVAAAWVLFGSSYREARENPLFKGFVRDRRL